MLKLDKQFSSITLKFLLSVDKKAADGTVLSIYDFVDLVLYSYVILFYFFPIMSFQNYTQIFLAQK